MKRILVVAALAVGLAIPAWGQDFDAGLAAHERGDVATAFKHWEPLAERGHAEAQYGLGDLYHGGWGDVPQDCYAAARWYRKAAEQGLAEAQYALGGMYDDSYFSDCDDDPYPQDDYVKAMQWYRLAAEQGDVYGQLALGLMYENGEGVPQDDAEAAKWYRSAAEQGYTRAQYKLGVMYFKGWGVRQDYVEAHKWVNLAVTIGLEEEAHKWVNLAVTIGLEEEDMPASIGVRNRMAEKLTGEQIAEAQRLAREWQPKAE